MVWWSTLAEERTKQMTAKYKYITLTASLDCPFLISPSVFSTFIYYWVECSNVYIKQISNSDLYPFSSCDNRQISVKENI